MGFYIGLTNSNYENHKEYEPTKYSGGRELASLLREIECENIYTSFACDVIRPKNIDDFRKIIPRMSVNHDLWYEFADEMEKDEQWGIELNY